MIDTQKKFLILRDDEVSFDKIEKQLKKEYSILKRENNPQALHVFHEKLNNYMKEPSRENRRLNDFVKLLRGECMYKIQNLYSKGKS